MKKKIAFVVLFLLISSVNRISLAATPVITNFPASVTHKQPASISGVDFGQKDTPKPLRYEDFEEGINGVQVSSEEETGGLETTAGVVYDDTYQRFLGAQNAQQNFNNGIYNQEIGLNKADSITSDKLYMHGYWRMDRHGAITRNAKFLNLGQEYGASNWSSRVDFGSLDGIEYSQITLTMRPECPGQDVKVAWGSDSDARKVMGDDDEWHRIESYIDLSRGYRNLYIDNELIMEVQSTDMTLGCLDKSIGYVYFGHYYTNDSFTPTPEAERWWDEIYIDTTQARVELCDSPLWSSRSHCEIQIPSDWSDSSITFTVNQGSFLESDSAYLYVIDAEGNVSNNGQGVEITIRDGSITSPPPEENNPTIWSATEQTGDSSWSDSSVTYCARLLIKGTSVTKSASSVVLGFQGRSSGDYIIKKVSIAEADIAAGEGNVVDSTWTKVAFDSTAWTENVTVPADTEKLSDPIAFNLEAGKDYYVTFKIETPSVYLDPPADYRELYFYDVDHTDDVDWLGNGHSSTQDFHAFSNIYPHSGSKPHAPSDFKLSPYNSQM